MKYDAKELERQIKDLEAARQKLVHETPALLEKLRQHIADRQGIVAGQLQHAKSPASRLALGDFEKSDAALWSSTEQVAAAGNELIASSKAWHNSIRSAAETLQEARSGIEEDTAEDVARASGALAGYVESIARSAPVALDAALVLEYLVLVELHDANAMYLNKKEWQRSKEAEAAGTLLEALAEHAVDVVVTAGVTAAGFTPHGWVIVGVLAGGKAIYALTKSQVEEARKQLAGAINDIDKLYVLQQLNEQLTGSAHTVVKLLQGATAAMGAQRTAVLDKAANVWRARAGRVDEALAQSADLLSVVSALQKK